LKTEKRLTTTQAAKILGLSSSTVLRAVKDKAILAHITPGGHFRIPLLAVEAFRRQLAGGAR
jgi:excisionase family DNA binding protein